MLLRIDGYEALDARKLMDLYAEGNRENAEYFFPDDDPATGTAKVEAGFLDFLKNEFLPRPENTCWVLEQDGVYLSALRLTELPERRFYLEALETHPAYRRRGYAKQLLLCVVDALKAGGPLCICDCVGKRNTASVETHKSAGFAIVSEAGYDYLQNESGEHHYGFEYRYTGE